MVLCPACLKSVYHSPTKWNCTNEKHVTKYNNWKKTWPKANYQLTKRIEKRIAELETELKVLKELLK